MLPPNDDATLSNLTLDGITIVGFDSAVFEYNNVDPGNTFPTVGAIPTDDDPKDSIVIINQASDVTSAAVSKKSYRGSYR